MGYKTQRMDLRPYQAAAVTAIAGRMRKHRRVLAVAPTGSGKSVIAAAFVASRPRARVLWVAHRIELLRQALSQLSAAGIHGAGMLSGTERFDETARVVVASIDMLRENATGARDLVVIDEAHRIEAKSYQDLLLALPDAKTLGLTATPWRLDGRGLANTFDNMLVMASMEELMVDGHIARPLTYGITLNKAREMVRGIESRKGDYAVGALGEALMKAPLLADVVSETQRLAPGLPTLVFAVSRTHGHALHDRFVQDGRRCAYVDGETPAAERTRVLASLRSGAVDVLVNIDVLTEGFDCPPVKCVAIVRPTRSLTRFLQYVGRASRPYMGKRPIILDHAGNCYRHGLPDAVREWSLDDAQPSDATGVAPVRQCHACGAMMHAGVLMCPECGAEQRQSERSMEEERGRLERLRLDADHRSALLARLNALARRRGLSDRWVEKTMQRLTA